MRLPVIVGFGGVGAAGRSSFHHAYDRTIWGSLDDTRQRTTVTALAAMMNLAFERGGQLWRPASRTAAAGNAYDALAAEVLAGTLIRHLEGNHFDPDRIPGNTLLGLGAEPSPLID